METSLSLLERLTGRPTEADWQRLVELYQPLLRAWMGRAHVPAADADDLTQEVLFVVFREVHGFDRRRTGAFRAWLRAILANRLRTYCRQREHRPQTVNDSAILDELELPGSELSQLWDRDHNRHIAGQMMQRVRGDFAPPTWEAFRRYVLDDRPAAEVAAELGLSLNSVLLARSRVLKRLREELNGLVD